MTKFKQIISYAILVIASFLSAFPLYYMLCGATNQSIDVVRGRLIPGTYMIENFKTLVDMQNLGPVSYTHLPVLIALTALIVWRVNYEIEFMMDDEWYSTVLYCLLYTSIRPSAPAGNTVPGS